MLKFRVGEIAAKNPTVFFPSCFPNRILRASLYYPMFYTQTLVLAYFVYNGQLLILQGLHLYWAYLVFKILKKFIFVKVRMDSTLDI